MGMACYTHTHTHTHTHYSTVIIFIYLHEIYISYLYNLIYIYTLYIHIYIYIVDRGGRAGWEWPQFGSATATRTSSCAGKCCTPARRGSLVRGNTLATREQQISNTLETH